MNTARSEFSLDAFRDRALPRHADRMHSDVREREAPSSPGGSGSDLNVPVPLDRNSTHEPHGLLKIGAMRLALLGAFRGFRAFHARIHR